MLIKNNNIHCRVQNEDFFSLRASCPFGGFTRSHMRTTSKKKCECESLHRSLECSLTACFTRHNWRALSQANFFQAGY